MTIPSKTKPVVFIQRSRLGRVTFELSGNRVNIFGRSRLKKINLSVDLADAHPQFERHRHRVWELVSFPLTLAVGIGWTTWDLRFLPQGLYNFVAMFGAISVLALTWAAIRGVPPVELVRVRNRSEFEIFEVIKEQNQAVEFEQFIAELHSRVSPLSN